MSRVVTLVLTFLCLAFGAYLISPFLNLRVAIAVLLLCLGCFLVSALFFRQSKWSSLNNLERVDSNFPHASGKAFTGTLLDATMSSMREGVIVVDHNMRVVTSNPAATKVFSGIAGNMEGKRLTDITRLPSILNAFGTALEQGEVAEVEVEMRERDRVTFDLRVAPLRLNEQAKTSGAIGVFFDITRLERLERVRQEFLSNVSHELRTPLTAILAFIETLQSGAINDPENNQKFLSIIGRNASRMHSLINDILELSAIEAGTVSIEPEPLNLKLMANDVISSLASRANTNGVGLINGVAAETEVFADPRRLEQMLTNLVDNAIKFTREGGSVTIGYEREEMDRITVIDTGEGIPPEHIKRIFERFYRVDRARSRELGGTGLGLAIVKHLARAHGGEVGVQSILGQGSTFTVELPRLFAEAGIELESSDKHRIDSPTMSVPTDMAVRQRMLRS